MFAHGSGGPGAASKDASKITAKGMKSITNRFFGLIMVWDLLKH